MEINMTCPQAKLLADKWKILSIVAKAKVAQAFEKSGRAIERESKISITDLIYSRPLSASGYVRTGRLRDTISTDLTNLSKPEVSIGPHTNYAVFVEFGTWKMPARPFMETGMKNAKSDMDEIFKNLLNAIVSEMK